jgi:hypothetical protein
MSETDTERERIYSTSIKDILEMLPPTMRKSLATKIAYHTRDLISVLSDIGTDLSNPLAFRYVISLAFANMLKGLPDKPAGYMYLFTVCKSILKCYSQLTEYAEETEIDVIGLADGSFTPPPKDDHN